MNHTIGRKISVIVAMILMCGTASAAVKFPFTGAKVAPSQDVIAGNLDEITPQNTVTVVHNVPQVAVSTSAVQMPDPSAAAVGVVDAIKDPNMSQKVPDCPPPPTPPASCDGCGCGSPGSVTWSGWDKVTGGVCANGGSGGWLVTQAGSAPYCPPPPPPATSLDSQNGDYAAGTRVKCSSDGTCVISYGITEANGQWVTESQTTTVSDLENGGVSYGAGTSNQGTVSLSGNSLAITNDGMSSVVNANTNQQISGTSIAQQRAQTIAYDNATGHSSFNSTANQEFNTEQNGTSNAGLNTW